MRLLGVLRIPGVAWVCQPLIAVLLMPYSEMASWAMPMAVTAEIPGTQVVVTSANPCAIYPFRCIYVWILASERIPGSSTEHHHPR